MDTFSLKGSVSSHRCLFKLVQLLTYFTLQIRREHPEYTTKDFLAKWLSSSSIELARNLSSQDSLVVDLDRLVMPFVLTLVIEKKADIELFGLRNPEEIKTEILKLINEYWLPF